MPDLLATAERNAHWRNTPEDRAIAAKLRRADALAMFVQTWEDLGYGGRALRAALDAYHNEGETHE
jgi:hypothetical protein